MHKNTYRKLNTYKNKKSYKKSSHLMLKEWLTNIISEQKQAKPRGDFLKGYQLGILETLELIENKLN